MYARVVGGVITKGPTPRLPAAERRLDDQAWVSFIDSTPVELVEETGWMEVTEVPPPTLTDVQRAELSYTVEAGRPTQTWTVRTETADENLKRVRSSNFGTLTNTTTILNRLTDLREFLTDADVTTFMATANNTPFGPTDRRALKTALRTIDRLTKLVEREMRARNGGSLLDDITNT